jgi:F-type H+-transporting ATPase subunit b
MPRKVHVILLVLFLPLFLCFFSAEEHARVSALTDFLGKTLNFILLFGGLAFVLAKPIRRYLEARTAAVREMINTAIASRKEAEEKLEAMQRRLQGLQEEVRKIKGQGEVEGEKTRKDILERARLEAEKLREFARQEIETRLQEARRELREYAAELAVSLAQAKIEKRLTPGLHSRLIEESIEQLGSLHEKSNSG